MLLKNQLLITLSVISLSLGSCSIGSSNTPSPIPDIPPKIVETPTQKIESPGVYATGFLSIVADMPATIVSNTGFVACSQEQVRACGKSTINALLQNNPDQSLCTEIKDQALQSMCEQTLVVLTAKSEKNPDACSTLSGEIAISCKMEVALTQAIEKKDVTLCDPIQQLSTTIPGDYIDGQYNLCIMRTLAELRELADPDQCKLIKNPGMSQACLQGIIDTKGNLQQGTGATLPTGTGETTNP